jgi:hypothetical protein
VLAARVVSPRYRLRWSRWSCGIYCAAGPVRLRLRGPPEEPKALPRLTSLSPDAAGGRRLLEASSCCQCSPSMGANKSYPFVEHRSLD